MGDLRDFLGREQRERGSREGKKVWMERIEGGTGCCKIDVVDAFFSLKLLLLLLLLFLASYLSPSCRIWNVMDGYINLLSQDYTDCSDVRKFWSGRKKRRP